MKKKSSSPGDPKAISSDLRAQLESQSAEIEKMKRSAADSKRDTDRHKKETWEQRNNPDGVTKGGRKKGGKNTTAPAPAPAPTAAAAATAVAENG